MHVGTGMVTFGTGRSRHFRIDCNGSAVVATFPPAMLTQQVIGPALTSLEIMHVFWQDSFDETLTCHTPLALSLSIFQLRRRGSDDEVGRCCT
jgi:hypothetical protein